MSSFPHLFLFSSTLFSSTIIALSASHWLMLWVALEMNMISFIPLITTSNQFQETEAAIKYFLFQALGSSLLLLGSYSPETFTLVTIGMLAKLGMAPFHFWFPSVMNAMSWPTCLLLTTWQKIIPLSILVNFSCFQSSSSVIALGSLNAIVGGIGGLNQTQIRPLLAYSSIGHMGWILAASTVSASTSSIYFLIYSITSITLFLFLYLLNINSVKLFSSLSSINILGAITLTLLLLSLGGLPPLTGFLPKWLVISNFDSLITPFILILGSLMNLFYYLNICFSLSLSKLEPLLMDAHTKLSFFIIFIISTLILPMFLFYALILLNKP